MFETLDKLMLAGLGAISMTREKAEKIFDEYVSRGETEKAGKTGFVKKLMDHAEENRKHLEELISDQVNKTVNNLNLATKDDIKRLEAKLDQLLNKG
jgi:polyhydroxyalkanoate synthesis regulator phasin